MTSVSKKNLSLHLLLLFLAVLIVYSNSLHNAFLMDDPGLILQDTKLHNWKFLFYQFIPDHQKNLNLESGGASPYYRPLAHIVPMLCYLSFGKNVFGYHLVNLVLFYLCLTLIYFLIRRLFPSRELALLVSFLYAVHPLNGLFVNYVTASVFAVQMIAMIGALLLFLRAMEGPRPVFPMLGSLVFYLISLLCHESALAFPLLLIPTIWLLQKKLDKKLFNMVVPYYVLSAIYVIFRLNYASLQASLFSKISAAHIGASSFVASNIKLFFWYISKFFFFDGIVIKWTIPPVTEHFFVWFFAFVVFVAVGVDRFLKQDRVKFWGISWLLIGFTPAVFGSAFELRYGFIFEPHWLFFPSLGMFVILAEVLLSLRQKAGKVIYVSFLAAIFCGMIFHSWAMNRLWGNEIDYCRYWLKHCPTQKGARFFLAAKLMSQGEYARAKEQFRLSLEGMSLDWQIYNNLGLIAQEEGNIDEALVNFQNALERFPKSSVVNNNLGVVHLRAKRLPQAETYFKQAMAGNPFFLEPRLNLADVYLEGKNYQDAAALYRDNLKIEPHDPASRLGLLKVFIAGQQDENIPQYILDIMRESHPADFYLTNAILLAQSRYFQLSIPLFQRALALNPSSMQIHVEWGKFLANTNRLDDAIAVWENALSLKGDRENLRSLIAQAKEINLKNVKYPISNAQ